MQSLAVQIQEIVKQQFDLDEYPTLSTNLKDLGADSLDEVELAMEIECKFGIDISDEQMEKWSTLQNILDQVAWITENSSKVRIA